MENNKNFVPGNTVLTLLFKGLYEDAEKLLRLTHSLFEENIYYIIKNLQLGNINELAIHLDKLFTKIIALRANYPHLIDLPISNVDVIIAKVPELAQKDNLKDFGQFFLAVIDIAQEKYGDAFAHAIKAGYNPDKSPLSQLEEIEKSNVVAIKTALVFSLVAYIKLKTSHSIDAIRLATLALHLNPDNTAAEFVIAKLTQEALDILNNNPSKNDLENAKLISKELINFGFSIDKVRSYGVKIHNILFPEPTTPKVETKITDSINFNDLKDHILKESNKLTEELKTLKKLEAEAKAEATEWLNHKETRLDAKTIKKINQSHQTLDQVKLKVETMQKNLSELKKKMEEQRIKLNLSEDTNELNDEHLNPNNKTNKETLIFQNNKSNFGAFFDSSYEYESGNIEKNPFKQDFPKNSNKKFSRENTVKMEPINKNSATKTLTNKSSEDPTSDMGNFKKK